MIEDEINSVFNSLGAKDIVIRWQERGHHNDPEKLRAVIQSEIDKAEEGGAELIMLAYGLCGNGALGLHTDNAVLAMPRFDDCVNMMLCTGKRDRRNYLEPGNMYLTGGWSRDEGALLDMFSNYLSKYGERKGKKVMKLMLDSYSKVTVIDTGCYDIGPVREYAEKCAEQFGLMKEEVEGSNRILYKLIAGEWDEDILVIEPGVAVKEEDFGFQCPL